MKHDAPTPSLLHLDASVSPAGESVSRQLTALFADSWRERYGDTPCGYRYRDLAAEPVPLVTAAYARFGYWVERHGTVAADQVAALVRDAEDERVWRTTLPLVEEVLAADVLLLGVPMYNLTVPAALMAWIDRVSFPGALLDPGTGTACCGTSTSWSSAHVAAATVPVPRVRAWTSRFRICGGTSPTAECPLSSCTS